MCGIIGAFHYGKNKTNVNEITMEIMEDQILRGEDGFGAIFIDEKGKFITKRATELQKLFFDNYMNPSKMMILHHRYPTSTDNKINQTHPMLIKNKSLKFEYLIVHNGVITNEDKLKEKHEKAGFKYLTEDEERFNDSESLAIEVAKFIENKITKIGAIGSCAFIALQYSKKTKKVNKIYYGRNNGNPLKLAKSRGFLYLSSDGKGDEIKKETLYSFDLKNFKIKKRKMEFAEKTYTYRGANLINDHNWCDDDPRNWCNNNDSKRIPFDDDNEIGFKDKDNKKTTENGYLMVENVNEEILTIEEDLNVFETLITDETTISEINIEREIKGMIESITKNLKTAYNIASNYYEDKYTPLINKEKIELPQKTQSR